jgi:phage shock protein PspC (stress-responsive transcriptional regulator)
MNRFIQKIIFFFELRSFGVCNWWAKKFGIRSEKVKMFFIYASFLALGSPIIIYLVMAFVLENKHFFKLQRKRKSIWDI